MSTFYERYLERRKKTDSLLCLGLDPDPQRLPEGLENNLDDWLSFTEKVVKSTAELIVSCKCNLAFYEALPFGMELLEKTSALIRRIDPEILLIADGKRGDIPNTAQAYARATFDLLNFDALTLNPYMGLDTLEPFYRYQERGSIVLCLTSNPGAQDYQDCGDNPLYLKIAADIAKLNQQHRNLWLVVGATRSPDMIRAIREKAPDVPFLIPGAGSQGGDLEETLSAAGSNCLINAGRSIIYAATSSAEIESAARKSATELVRVMRESLS